MKILSLFGMSCLLSLSAYAADKAPPAAAKAPEWTSEQRESMAKSHEQMAACLRSDKAVDACHEEMMSACKSNSSCQGMWGQGMSGHHMGKDHMGKGTKGKGGM